MALFNQFGRLLKGKSSAASESKQVTAKEVAPKVAEVKEKKSGSPGSQSFAKQTEVKQATLKQAPILGQSKHDIFPRITEKATFLSEKNVYVFNIGESVTKGAVKDAVAALFKVHPVKVSIIKIPGKKVFTRNRTGKTAKQKKAYVFLKQGEKIDIV